VYVYVLVKGEQNTSNKTIIFNLGPWVCPRNNQ